MTFGLHDGAHSDEILIQTQNISNGEIIVTYEVDGTEYTALGVIGEPQTASVVPMVNVVNEALPAAVPEIVPDAQTESETEGETLPAPEQITEQQIGQEVSGDSDVSEPSGVPAAVDSVDPAAVIGMPVVPQARFPWISTRTGEVLPAPAASGTVTVTKDAAGNIVVDLGDQVAVKKVTLRITGTGSEGSLASISHVEFVNGMEDRIPEPQLSIPEITLAAPASRQFTVGWSEQTNITGYKVMITEKESGVTEYFPLSGTSLTVTNFNNDEVINYHNYTVSVCSVNGTWVSGWSEPPVTLVPVPSGKPDAPDNVKATGGFQCVTVSWKNMKDTASYNLYYRVKADTEAAYTEIPDLTVTSYVITGLDSTRATEYEVYVVGVNEHGAGPESIHASATTTSMDPAEMPKFNLINRNESGTPGNYHITSAVLPNTSGVLVNSPADAAGGTIWGTVDNDPSSYYERATWDDGGYNTLSGSVGLIYSFDQAYEMDTIGMMSVDSSMDYTYIKIRWWDAAGAEHLIDRSVMSSERRTDEMGRTYFFLRMPEPITAQQIQIGVARYWAGNNRVAVSEVYFYKYDEIKRQIAALYADDLHTTLVDTVTEEQMTELKSRIENSVDEFGNVNPDKAQLLKEWETAWQIYNDQFLNKVTHVHTGITGSGDNHGFGGLNAWQPLGVVAAAGEKITVYVGSNLRKTGAETNLQLVVTQYFAEASAMSRVAVQKLRVGANEVMVPKVWTSTGFESGGALYVQYTGGAGTVDEYAVRVSGGVSVPVLDLYGVTDHGERLSRTSDYLSQLQEYSAALEATHAEKHEGDGCVSEEVRFAYNEQTCILQATDIMLDTMMLSLPARQILAGCGGSADTLLGSLDAMESMMYLFYQHKGLNASARDAVDRIPYRHLNIRYQRMFSGAFMYASGDHIGIGWNETAGMAGCPGVVTDENGRYVSGNYFGWGIAHEIGHDINQGTYAIAEITNNYFAVLAQAQDNNGSVRFEYPKVYEKVTSGTKGRANNVFTQLGMYWQLHLAYDKGYNFKTYANYDEQFANLFWARVDTYARTPSKAPNGLSLECDMDQALMRLCCAAAGRNILEFFERWGKTPDETTIAYANNFEKETRAIYYVCDDSRAYTLANGGASKLASDGSTDAIDAVSVAMDPNQANKVDITITPSASLTAGEILGYEIVRCTIAGGVTEKKTVGFTTANTFSDVVYAMNNRTVSYEVTLVDQYLNRSAVESTGMVKIQHEGALAKDHWTVATAGLKADPISVTPSDDDPDAAERDPASLDAAAYIADGKVESVYTGTVELSEEAPAAIIELDFHETNVITGLICRPDASALGDFVVDVRQNGEWLRVNTHSKDNSIFYFSNAQGSYVSTYSADAVRLTLSAANGAQVSVAEIDVMGPSGDNVDFRSADGSAAIGYLSQAFQYSADDATHYIPDGSLVFTGTYKGNAAYNVVMVYDQDGVLVTGVDVQKDAEGNQLIHQVAEQTILSQVPATGNIQDVADGTWVYWIAPQYMDIGNGFKIPQRVRVELYRVNDALNNEGERLVSDSVFVDVPQTLGQITLGANG